VFNVGFSVTKYNSTATLVTQYTKCVCSSIILKQYTIGNVPTCEHKNLLTYNLHKNWQAWLRTGRNPACKIL